MRLVDLLGDIAGDEALDLAVDAAEDPEHRPAQRRRPHVDVHVAAAWLVDVDHHLQRFGGAGGQPQCDVAVDVEALLVQREVDQQMQPQWDVEVEADEVAGVAGQAGVADRDVRRYLGQLRGAGADRAEVETAAREFGEGAGDAGVGDREFEEATPEPLVADVGGCRNDFLARGSLVLHSSQATPRGRAQTPKRRCRAA